MLATDTTTWHRLAPALVREHLAQTGPGPVVEVGVWRGELSERLLELSALTHLTMVDPWEPSLLQTADGRWFVCGPGNTTEEMEESYGYAQKVAARAGARACVVVVGTANLVCTSRGTGIQIRSAASPRCARIPCRE